MGSAGVAGEGTGALAGLSQQMSHLGIAGEEVDPRENPRERGESGKDHGCHSTLFSLWDAGILCLEWEPLNTLEMGRAQIN